LFVERQRALHVRLRNAPDGEPDVIQHVVTDRDRLVHEVEPDATAHTPEIHERAQLVDFNHETRNTQTHLSISPVRGSTFAVRRAFVRGSTCDVL